MANFNQLKTIDDLNSAFERSNSEAVVLFKHSVTCPISTGVYSEVAGFDGDVNLVIVQTNRDLSNEISARTGVRHESPQALVIRNGTVGYHASHYDITAGDIAKATGTR